MDNPLNPTYLLFIPSKVFLVFNDGQRKSTLVLSPVSYEVITEQIVSGITRNQIVRSKLPAAFFAKRVTGILFEAVSISGIRYQRSGFM